MPCAQEAITTCVENSSIMIFCLACSLLATTALAHFRSSKADTFIYDDENRVVFFHGTNFVQKGFPWYPQVLLDSKNIEEMKTWGFNTARVGLMWSGVEPEPGVFNETYIDIMTGIVDELERNGIFALIDVHQDVLSSYFCEYDGAPTWLVDLSTSSTQAFPWPLPGTCADRPWGSNYLAEATGAAFQDIYDNTNGMRDHFANFWRKVAEIFKDRRILGYEIINEPWAGDIYTSPSLLLPGEAGARNLQPLYDVISSAIREVDAEHIIFYEPVTWGMIFNGTISGSGFTHVPGGSDFTDKSVFSFHYYCWWYTDGSGLEKRTCDKHFGPKVFAQAVIDARQLGGSVMLTEWGQGCAPANGLMDECNAVMDLADTHLISWIDWYWQVELFTSWAPSTEAIAVYSRTFARTVAGTPTSMHYNTNSAQFVLCYDVNLTISKPTEIAANFDVHYPYGVEVNLSGSLAKELTVHTDDSNNLITVMYTGTSTSADYKDCCVTVIKKWK